MKIFKNKFITSMMLLTVLSLIPQVYAKTSIEIKPNTSIVYTNKTISDFFEESKEMKKTGEVLEGATVDVHMATNKDWAVVSYFSNSAYGTSGEGQNTGITISVDGKDYLSTNGNVTGVMDFGRMPTYTAGVLSYYGNIKDTEETEEVYDYGKNILENVNNNLHVDIIIGSSNDYINSIAARSWYDAKKFIYTSITAPYSVRRGLFSIHSGDYKTINIGAHPDGNAQTTATFRPIIWN